ncbi:MAG: helix-turn-helix transcriptional regulator [Chloroflexi bacterium]|nr:helix-turn-helix transcriptional regulator [Chloroflexota bacterium]MBI3931650.1 helix-turn-helix transcriptional regulator [Chloroflexota bacterium]
MPQWTFLTNHAIVLSFLAKHPRITARELSLAIGITERTVRRFIADLDTAGYITKKREGRGVRYRINPDLSLRHDTYQEMAIGDFLESLGWKRRKKRPPVPEAEGQAEARSNRYPE